MTTTPAPRIVQTIAQDIGAAAKQVTAAITLLDEGATVPFVARYRKEATGGLDDTQLRTLSERLSYLRELEDRRATILKSIDEQGKLTEALARDINAAATKATLEDLYLPYKPKRRTRAEIARENGLAPLADAILSDRGADPEALAAGYLTEAVADVKTALNGARDIIAESLTENADLLGRLRSHLQATAVLTSRVNDGMAQSGAKYSDYFEHTEKWATVPSHRALAMMRASNEKVVSLDIGPADEAATQLIEDMIAAQLAIAGAGAGDLWLRKLAKWTWRVKLSLTMMLDLMGDLRARAQEEAITVFARNLKDLLLAAPAGNKAVLGLDPGIRTGCKLAVVDATGKALDTATIYPFEPRKDVQGAMATLRHLIEKHGVALIAVGNGTASRESERLVEEVIRDLPGQKPSKVVVSEAGASVYSASELAAREFPDLDVSLRGAISIARRLQDPLAELVKIDPKSIGVGQYQHDVDQSRLAKALDGVVEDAVNAVGVDLNMASAPLLARVSGLGLNLAEMIVAHRDAHGAFAARQDLMQVPRLGQKTFEQCAGFLRIRDGAEPLDASAVHPEAYEVARSIVAACGRDIRSLMQDPRPLAKLNARDFVSADFGEMTVRDILQEIEKPGRDPRPEFKTAKFTDGVESIRDLKAGMMLEGTVTNVAAFGAFVDIGVHQDGLVHVSQLADRFIKDPHDVVKAGQIVKVRVTEVDVPRNRIGLSMRKSGSGTAAPDRSGGKGAAQQERRNAGAKPRGKQPTRKPQQQTTGSTGALGDALMQALKKGK
ncbi:Tex family protein [Cognatishimia sp. SS12]|uniref:Tex family protein n=1 Tax=Cognatishimia sp. SS12 TaxID=2979465 RepID=UPI00232ED242|nr:Tex family protein [Cognatishimia sp. SS12]MDC0737244.1 Tex family protein [Cognatishimia sp. SS12]